VFSLQVLAYKRTNFVHSGDEIFTKFTFINGTAKFVENDPFLKPETVSVSNVQMKMYESVCTMGKIL
jgi:hypothetical protein